MAAVIAAAVTGRELVLGSQPNNFATLVDAIRRKEIIRQMDLRSITVKALMADTVVATNLVFTSHQHSTTLSCYISWPSCRDAIRLHGLSDYAAADILHFILRPFSFIHSVVNRFTTL
jgi:hypothetical protein